MSFTLDVSAHYSRVPAPPAGPAGRRHLATRPAQVTVPLSAARHVYDQALAAKAAGRDWTEADTARAVADARAELARPRADRDWAALRDALAVCCGALLGTDELRRLADADLAALADAPGGC